MMKMGYLYLFAVSITIAITAGYIYRNQITADFTLLLALSAEEIESGSDHLSVLSISLNSEGSIHEIDTTAFVRFGYIDEEMTTISKQLKDGKGDIEIRASDQVQEINIQVEVLGRTGTTKLTIKAGSPDRLEIEAAKETKVVDGKSTVGFTVWVVDRYGNTIEGENSLALTIEVTGPCKIDHETGLVDEGYYDGLLFPIAEKADCQLIASTPRLKPGHYRFGFNIDDKDREIGDDTSPDLTQEDEWLRPTTTDNPYPPLFLKAVEEVRSGNLQVAAGMLRNLIVTSPEYREAWLLLGKIEYHLGNLHAAQDQIEKYLLFEQDDDEALYFLAEILIGKDPDLKDKAIEYWTKVIQHGKDIKLVTLSRDRIAQINYQHDSGETFETDYFIITYDKEHRSSREKRSFRADFSDFATYAYRTITKDLDHRMSRKTQIVLYSSAEYKRFSALFHFNTAGFFDGNKIRLNDALELTDEIKALLMHEFTHAVLFDASPKRPIPTWLNEGLAQREERYITIENGLTPKQLRILKIYLKSNQISFLALSHGFQHLNQGQAELAYLLSLAMVLYLIDVYGMRTIPLVIEEFNKGKAMDDAFSAVLYKPFNTIEKDLVVDISDRKM